MKILKTFEEKLRYICVRPEFERGSHIPFIAKCLRVVEKVCNPKTLHIYAMAAFNVQCLALFICWGAETFQDYSETAYSLAMVVTSTWGLNLFELAKLNLFQLIDNVECVIEKRSINPASLKIYEETNAFVEKWHKRLMFTLFQVTIPCISLPYFVWSYFLYYIKDMGNEALREPFAFWLSFDWKTPLGYFILFMYEVVSIYYIVAFCAVYMAFPLGMCRFMGAFADDITLDVNSLNCISEGERFECYEKLCSFIKFHSTLKRVISDYNDLYAFMYTVYFCWTVVGICTALLTCEVEFSSGTTNLWLLIKMVGLLTWASVTIFLFCDFGEDVAIHFNTVDIYYTCDWSRFPTNVRRIFPIIMLNTKKSVIIQGYGNVPVSRETFKRIINSASSYFMICRQFLK